MGKRRVSLSAIALALLCAAVAHHPAPASARQPFIPIMYYKIDTLMDFRSPDEAEVTINQTVYGDASTLVERLISRSGEEVYCAQESDLTRLRLADRPLVTGTAIFKLAGNVSVLIDRGLSPINWTRISTKFTIRANITDNSTVEYMITDYLSQLYTQPLVIPTVTGEKVMLLPIYTLNLTAVMPPGYIIQTGGPRASYVKPIYYDGQKRALINWFIRNPAMEYRGTQHPFTTFYVVLARAPPDILELEDSLSGLLSAAEGKEVDPALMANASFALYQVSLYGYAERVNLTSIMNSLSTAQERPPSIREISWAISAAVTVTILLVAIRKGRGGK